MKRAALDRPRAIRAWRQHAILNSTFGFSSREYHPGHFRKGLRVGGCGNPACRLCHAGKIDGYPSLKEFRHNLTYREQLTDAAL